MGWVCNDDSDGDGDSDGYGNHDSDGYGDGDSNMDVIGKIMWRRWRGNRSGNVV